MEMQQPVKSQKGEIEFRKKLCQQQVYGEKIFNDEFNAKQMKKLLQERMKKTFHQMMLLKKKGIILSPYLEIGAERCQRSLVMENDIGAKGVAADISYDMLKSGDYYMKIFNKNKIPLRICCDANNLPFMSNSIPFVFCYETLHHFPSPTPIMKEIHRVISPGGYFFLDEEPCKQILRVKLYKGKKVYSKESLNASKIKFYFDRFFVEEGSNEVEHGIIENDQITLNSWKQAFSFFKEKNIRLSKRGIGSGLFNPKNYIRFLFAYLFGGTVSGTCRKSGINIEKDEEISIYDVLICPSCFEGGRESKLSQKNNSFSCKACHTNFPIVDGIIFLFPYKKFKELYPEIFKKVFKKYGKYQKSGINP